MRKVLNTAVAALLLTSLALPIASQADEPDPESGNTETTGSEHDKQQIDHMHTEIEEVYKDYSGVLIPPVVIQMGQAADPNIFVLPNTQEGQSIKPGMGSDQQIDLEQLGLISGDQKTTLDPYRHAPIPIDSLVKTSATPTDEFIEGARIFGSALVIAAIGLSALTGVNTFRSRRRRSIRPNSAQQ